MLQHLRRGTELAADGDWDSALTAYRMAYAAQAAPQLLLNIGTALRMLGRNAAAARAYERYLNEPEAEPHRKRQLARHLKEIDELVARVSAVVSEPAAELRLDGQPLRLSDGGRRLTFLVDPGEHNIVAQKPGKHPAIVNFSAAPRERLGIRLKLVDASEPKPPPKEHDQHEGDVQRAVAFAVTGIGVVGVGLGAVFGLLASDKNAEAARYCSRGICDGRGEAIGSTALAFANVSTAGFIAGGVASVAGVALYFSAPEAPAAGDGGPEMAVLVGPGSLLVRGAW